MLRTCLMRILQSGRGCAIKDLHSLFSLCPGHSAYGLHLPGGFCIFVKGSGVEVTSLHQEGFEIHLIYISPCVLGEWSLATSGSAPNRQLGM